MTQTQSTPPAASPALRHRWRRWLLLALPVLLALLLAAVAGASWWLQQQGLQLQGLGWRDGGATVAQWQWRQQDCVAAQGSGLRIERWQPLTIALQQLQLQSCAKPGPRQLPAPPPAGLPPFTLRIASLQAPALPALAVTVTQQNEHWQAQLAQGADKLALDYRRDNGQWQAQGMLAAARLAPPLLGQWQLHGSGRWLPGQLHASVQADGRQLGYPGDTRRGDARLQATLHNRQWQLDATLPQALPLAAGWLLQPRRALQASGDLDGVHSLQADLLASGPQGRLQLQLTPQDQSLQRGRGLLQLDGKDLHARIPLQWSDRQLTLAAGDARLPQGLRLSWPQAWQLPLTASGSSRLPFRLDYQQLQLSSNDGTLQWGDGRWQWQGALALAGRHAGFRLAGQWRGQLDPQGAHGSPLQLNVSKPPLALAISLPVNHLDPRQPALGASVAGHYQDWPLKGSVTARQQGAGWQGSLTGDSRLPFYSRGGALQLAANWRGSAGKWQLDNGSKLSVAEGIVGGVLLKPLSLQATSALLTDGSNAHGQLALSADGAVTSRWTLPPASGTLQLAGERASGQLQLPAWRSKLQLSARRQGEGASGSVQLDTPLSAAMSRGLGVTLQQGQLAGTLQWQWQKQWQLNGDVRLSDVALDWGGILANGGRGRLTLAARPGQLQLQSDGPLQLAQLDVGTLLQEVSLTLRSDLQDWQLGAVRAKLLGGSLQADSLHWPSSAFQTVTVQQLDLAAVAALQNDPQPTVQLTGRVGGTLPLQLLPSGIALQDGLLRNEGELTLRVPASAGVTAMAQSNRAVQLALDMLSELDVNDFQARLAMQQNGLLDARVTLKGVNPKQNRQPVVLNYSHSENVLELLRSLRIGDEISRRVLSRKQSAATRNPTPETTP
ncbi:intermembrane phospholipid transport protein YdbH family protein [Vogesella indigofera]|uniref:intermembrane phospholipid transport protein YdbH family protein n=1 Tax=Vogesella indigofera TaxID=45465 RepID=UPI00234F0AF4|nr:YdbH domain-containing protein [Vogesella indigofera]MDC7699767.1 YdbH domain-containing protein [Vogesella indigofera]